MRFSIVRRKILRRYFVGAEVLPEQVNTPPTLLFLPHYRLLNPLAHCRCHVVKRFLLMLSVISYIKAPTDLSDGSGWCGWNITVCRRMEK